MVKIIETQHETWQGSLTQALENKTVYFRSALELLKMMDEEIERCSVNRQNTEKLP